MLNTVTYGTIDADIMRAFAAIEKRIIVIRTLDIEPMEEKKNTMRDPLAFMTRTVRASAALQRKLVHYSLCFIYPDEISNGSDLDVKETGAQRSMLENIHVKCSTFLLKSIKFSFYFYCFYIVYLHCIFWYLLFYINVVTCLWERESTQSLAMYRFYGERWFWKTRLE